MSLHIIALSLPCVHAGSAVKLASSACTAVLPEAVNELDHSAISKAYAHAGRLGAPQD